ncbi:MAG: c-type cytochrome [Acidobacteria bacterium]|nr:c-type cytochrome [Acidobacteriota bacterium]
MRKQFLGIISALATIATLAGAQTTEAARATMLEKVDVSPEGGSGINIEITTRGETASWVETLDHPARIVVDLPNTVLAADVSPILIRTSGVRGVRIGTDATRKTRVVVDLARLCKYELVPGSGHRLILKLHPASPALAADQGEPVESASLPPSPSAPAQSAAGARSPQTLAQPAFAPKKEAPVAKEAPAAPALTPSGDAAANVRGQSEGNLERGQSETPVKFSLEAAAIFNQRCTACHTYGKGVKVGPDLKGVTERRKRDWLLKFIHASSQVIKSGDPTATALFAQFKQQRMPDWTDLSEKQISDILDYFAVGGPDIKPEDERNAETATAAETEAGRKMFYGETRLQHGAPVCASCHSLAGTGMRGGTLGPDLTNVYFRYQDVALTAFFHHPCFSWARRNPDVYLTAKESFALKAFLRLAANATPARAATVDNVAGGNRR